MAVTLLEKVASLLKTILEGYSDYLKFVLSLRNEFLNICRGNVKLLILAKSPQLKISDLVKYSTVSAEEKPRYVCYFYNYHYPEEHLRNLTLQVVEKYFSDVKETTQIKEKLFKLSEKGIFVDYVVLTPIPPTLFNEILKTFRSEIIQSLKDRLNEIKPSNILVLGNIRAIIENVIPREIPTTQIKFPSCRKKDLHVQYMSILEELIKKVYGVSS